MSKSRGNVLYADTLVDFFGVDAVRYFVLHEMPFENDGVISWDLMVERMNSDLANVLGNLVNRTISMSNKYFGGIVDNKCVVDPIDDDLIECVSMTKAKVEAKMEKLRVADAITEIFTLFKRCNKYIDETTPWILAKDEDKMDRLATVLYNLVESITIGASLLEPFMPETTEKILAQLNTGKREFDTLSKFGLYKSGTKITDKPEILFQRVDIKELAPKIAEVEEEQRKAAAQPVTVNVEEKKEEVKEEKEVKEVPPCTIDDFCKVQMKVGEILECEKVPKADKLLCSKVKIGDEVRTIVSGIAKFYKPEDMVGRKVVVVTNLPPRKMRGIVSEGMLLCAFSDDDSKLTLLTVAEDMESGAEIG
jgi:methionyl-tRNA synthetase